MRLYVLLFWLGVSGAFADDSIPGIENRAKDRPLTEGDPSMELRNLGYTPRQDLKGQASGSVSVRRNAALDPAEEWLLFAPTAFLPPEGSVDFRSVHLLYARLGYAPSEFFALNAGTLAGIYWHSGIRTQLWENSEIGSALAASAGAGRLIVGDGFNLFYGNLAAGKRFAWGSVRDALVLHASAGMGAGSSESFFDSWYFDAGTEVRLTPMNKWILEYASPRHPTASMFLAMDLMGDTPVSTLGFISTAIRWHWKRASLDLGIMLTQARIDGEPPEKFGRPQMNWGYRF